jgi:hypothetical protein
VSFAERTRRWPQISPAAPVIDCLVESALTLLMPSGVPSGATRTAQAPTAKPGMVSATVGDFETRQPRGRCRGKP